MSSALIGDREQVQLYMSTEEASTKVYESRRLRTTSGLDLRGGPGYNQLSSGRQGLASAGLDATTPGVRSAMYTLSFDQGTLLLDAPPGQPLPGGLTSPPWMWDPRVRAWRAPALAYRELVTRFYRGKIPYQDQAARYAPLEVTHLAPKPPHPFQSEALEAWKKAGRRGIVVLPTGAGKTYVAELAIADARRSTLVVTPTLDLMNQWYDGLSSAFGIEIGLLGGGYHDIRPLTVTTYDSAYLHLDKLGDRFGFLVFDECHHLPSPSYAQAAEWAIAPFRLGLTATLERADGLHLGLDRLIGLEVYRRDIRDLAGEFLADYQVFRLEVDLSEEEFERYQEARAIYREFILSKHINMTVPEGFGRFVMLAAKSEEGRRAFRAFRESRAIALATPAKFEMLERLLLRHRRDRVLIFTHENSMVHEISRQFLIPTITHHTDVKERKEILDRFREGTYPVIATSRVLNEGVNLPAANVGIVLSGSGSVREHVQRLGRILRRQPDKEAILYEIITRRTLEERVSERRREHSAYR
jgi:superfamily II DNA or RNA helicase